MPERESKTGEVVDFWAWLRERWPYADIVLQHDRRLDEANEMPDFTNGDGDDFSELELGDVTPIKRLQPGDVLDVVQKLRRMMTSVESASYTIYASFEELDEGGALDRDAQKARHTLELATARVATLINSIEQTNYYQNLRRETLEKRRKYQLSHSSSGE